MTTSALADVKDVVDWLKHIEQLVGRLYARAARACGDDEDFQSFLARLADEEQSHSQFMSMVAEYLQTGREDLVLDIAVDPKTRERIEAPLKKFRNYLAGRNISKRRIIEYMVRAESSELNPVFLYIVNKFSEINLDAERMTAEIQEHLLRIDDYTRDLPHDLKPSIDVGTLPAVWEGRFLIVDNDEPLRGLIASLLDRRGSVETVAGPKEGLEKLREHYYDGVVSDIQMSDMDGFELYKRAVEHDLQVKGHFLFCSSDITPEREAYLKQNSLSYLRKPFELSELNERIDRIIRQ
ncbi:MAG: response regulator [Planctomycetota bacterium]|jgi:CheY-like chemotaxis protein